jgi:aspartyl-tRNA(Asn)/glutamyl-tRNA(Gln) amidotransferase subunit B
MSDFIELLGDYKLVLGLEIHLHLNTRKKMFCLCGADIFGKSPNTQTCPTCLGLPGALPVPNYSAVKKAQLLGLALNCSLNEKSRFDRKHYSYPDLAKGYQISQYLQPLSENGHLDLSSGNKVDIERVHLEEDTAKSFHKEGKTLVDFNKAGMPLVEIVTRPVFKTIEDAVEFSKRVQDIVRVLEIGAVDMEKGQMRLEANISLRTADMEREDKLPAYKVEVKNINSFKFMERAVKAEAARQKAVLDGGGTPLQENRGFDESKNETVSQRSKEFAHDYRYFPEPDIPPMEFTEEHTTELINLLPELPHEIKERLVTQYEISEKNAFSLTTGIGLSLLEKFEELVTHNLEPEKVANILINRPASRELSIGEFVKAITEQGDKIEDSEKLIEFVKQAVEANPAAVEDFAKGKETAVEFLLGKVMQLSQGKADPDMTRRIIKKLLTS